MAERYDCRVVGAGLGGAVAALRLARAGRRVILLPVGATLEESDLWAGVLWRAGGPDGSPRVPAAADLGRRIVERRLGLALDRAMLSVEHRFPRGTRAAPGAMAFVGARAGPEIRDALRRAGVEIAPSDRTGGPGAGADPLLGAAATIVTDTGSAHHRPRPARGPVRTFRRGFRLPASSVDNRFAAAPGEGAVIETILGSSRPGRMSAVSLFPGPDSVEVEVAVAGADLATAGPVEVEEHPSVAPFIAGGEARGPWSERTSQGALRPSSSSAGTVLVAGEALGLSAGAGFLVPSLDGAVGSAECAADAVIAAGSGARPARVAGAYRARMGSSGLLAEEGRRAAISDRLVWNPRWHRAYPEMLLEMFHRLMTESGGPKASVKETMRAVQRSAAAGRLTIAYDALRVGGAL